MLNACSFVNIFDGGCAEWKRDDEEKKPEFMKLYVGRAKSKQERQQEVRHLPTAREAPRVGSPLAWSYYFCCITGGHFWIGRLLC